MKKWKKVFDVFWRTLISAVVIIFLCVAPFTLLPNLLNAQAEVNRRENFEYQGILELWHIETFEGGSISRATFLEREALLFEKQHRGTYIVIETMSPEQLQLNLSAGKLPNMFSFGIGVGSEICEKLIDLDATNIRQDVALGGVVGAHQLAVPYILGGYATIENADMTDGIVGVGLDGATNPLGSLAKNGMQIAKLFNCQLDSYNAYDKFLKGNFQTLLGTQRDVYRCYNRQQNGLLQNVNYNFFSGYTDLVQYVAIARASVTEQEMCKKFVSQMLSKETQLKLANYNLFSTLQSMSLYSTGLFRDFELALQKKLQVENVFLDMKQIELNKQNAQKAVVLGITP